MSMDRDRIDTMHLFSNLGANLRSGMARRMQRDACGEIHGAWCMVRGACVVRPSTPTARPRCARDMSFVFACSRLLVCSSAHLPVCSSARLLVCSSARLLVAGLLFKGEFSIAPHSAVPPLTGPLQLIQHFIPLTFTPPLLVVFPISALPCLSHCPFHSPIYLLPCLLSPLRSA
jgi:hypothetical protein